MTSPRADRSVLILAGGRGERFWPWSRPERPKQLLPLAGGGRTLLAATLERALTLADRERILILTARDLVGAVRAECPGVPVVGEPVARNTAAAVGAAAAWFRARGARSFAVLPADHLIERLPAFTADLETAFAVAAREPVLLTFGVPVAAVETNFGYVQRAEKVGERLYRVASFKEKPDHATAERYVASGEYLWNSGMFVWGVTTFLDALETNRPGLGRPLRALSWEGGEAGFERALEPVFPALESISVDYAVLERASNVLVLEASFDWDDLGSWSAWARRQPKDAHGNVLFGEAVALDCERCVVVSEDREAPAAAMGLRDMVVVHTRRGTLACRLEDSDQVRRVTEAVRARGAR